MHLIGEIKSQTPDMGKILKEAKACFVCYCEKIQGTRRMVNLNRGQSRYQESSDLDTCTHKRGPSAVLGR